MYSGKTSKLVSSFSTNMVDNKIILDYDIGNNTEHIITHDGTKLHCVKCKTLIDYNPTQLYIYINEAQFFPDLVSFVLRELSLGKIIDIYGLDGDYKQQKIGNILELIPYCDSVNKLKGICNICGRPSIYTKRITNETKQIVFNETSYKPVCRLCI
jgi:thymidine kinase